MQRIRSLHERKAATGSPPIIVVMTAAEEELREAAPQPAKRAWIRRRTWRGEPYVSRMWVAKEIRSGRVSERRTPAVIRIANTAIMMPSVRAATPSVLVYGLSGTFIMP